MKRLGRSRDRPSPQLFATLGELTACLDMINKRLRSGRLRSDGRCTALPSAPRPHALFDRLRARIPGATILAYNYYNALAIGWAPDDQTSHGVLSLALYPRWVIYASCTGAIFPIRTSCWQAAATSSGRSALQVLTCSTIRGSMPSLVKRLLDPNRPSIQTRWNGSSSRGLRRNSGPVGRRSGGSLPLRHRSGPTTWPCPSPVLCVSNRNRHSPRPCDVTAGCDIVHFVNSSRKRDFP